MMQPSMDAPKAGLILSSLREIAQFLDETLAWQPFLPLADSFSSNLTTKLASSTPASATAMSAVCAAIAWMALRVGSTRPGARLALAKRRAIATFHLRTPIALALSSPSLRADSSKARAAVVSSPRTSLARLGDVGVSGTARAANRGNRRASAMAAIRGLPSVYSLAVLSSDRNKTDTSRSCGPSIHRRGSQGGFPTMTRLLLSSVAAAAVLAGASTTWAQTEIQWWHAMGGNLGETVNALAEGFNKS